jgi:hypothetical protein
MVQLKDSTVSRQGFFKLAAEVQKQIIPEVVRKEWGSGNGITPRSGSPWMISLFTTQKPSFYSAYLPMKPSLLIAILLLCPWISYAADPGETNLSASTIHSLALPAGIVDLRPIPTPTPTPSPTPTHPALTEQTVPDPDFVPKYDIVGQWSSDHSADHADAYRIGKHVVVIFNGASYEHLFEGAYTDDHTIEGIQLRRKTSDGSITVMKCTINLTSPDSGFAPWTALDSNSDLRKGQTGTAEITRVIPPQPCAEDILLVPTRQNQSPCGEPISATNQVSTDQNGLPLPAPSLSSNLLAFWNFDGSDPNSCAPNGGNLSYNLQTGNDGRGQVNPGSLIPGKIGKAIRFGSTGNQGLYLPSGDFPILTTFTITAWVKLDRRQSGDAHSLIACSWDGFDGWNFFMSIYRGKLEGAVGIGGRNPEIATDQLVNFNDRQWHFCVFQCLDNKFFRVRVDDHDWTTMPLRGSLLGAQPRPFQVGQNIAQSVYNANCTIDMLGVWNRCLSDDELARLYNHHSGQEYPFHETRPSKKAARKCEVMINP